MNTPILLLIFNRPEHTQKVFQAIKKIRPGSLYIASDGPRQGVDSDHEKVLQARSILNDINWECNVNTLFRDQNLGCGKAVSEAITWFFDNVEMGIILEDDCLVSIDFFEFCTKLLVWFRSNKNVMLIGGLNLSGHTHPQGYYYSGVSHVWGWATWRDRWQHYDLGLKEITPSVFRRICRKCFPAVDIQQFWQKKYEDVRSGSIDTWDYQLNFAMWKKSAYAIVPNQNLVRNIGFDENATHTKQLDPELEKRLQVTDMPLMIKPEAGEVRQNKKADYYLIRKVYLHRTSILSKIKFVVKSLLKSQ